MCNRDVVVGHEHIAAGPHGSLHFGSTGKFQVLFSLIIFSGTLSARPLYSKPLSPESWTSKLSRLPQVACVEILQSGDELSSLGHRLAAAFYKGYLDLVVEVVHGVLYCKGYRGCTARLWGLYCKGYVVTEVIRGCYKVLYRAT